MEKPDYFFSRLSVFLFCLLFLFAFGFSSLTAEEVSNDRAYPYSLGGGVEMNLNTREGAAMGYGAALDRYFIYAEDKGLLRAGVRFAMQSDFDGISATEGDIFVRYNLLRLGPGDIFTQLSWGFSSYREDEIMANTMLTGFSAGYRFYFLGGFYVEPYIRTGFPFLFGTGVMAGHWFSF